MSGLEVAGIVLGAFPLLISGIEHWRDVAKVGGFYWRIRKEYTKCQRDIQFHEIIYKNNLRELLLPLIQDANEVTKLIADPCGERWGDAALQQRLESRLNESYQSYQNTMTEMNEIAEELKKELCFDKKNIQDKLSPPETKKRSSSRSPSPQPSSRPSKLSATKGRLDYEVFRIKFSLGEPIRDELFSQLKECNERLEKLLSSSDRVSALQDVTPGYNKKTSELESVFKKVSKKSQVLFQALHDAWQCSCQHYHFANLRLEHRTLTEVCFKIVFMFLAPSEYGTIPWSQKEITCGNMPSCSQKRTRTATTLPLRRRQATLPTPGGVALPAASDRKRVGFVAPTSTVPEIQVDMGFDHNVELCQRLGDQDCGICMGIIGHDDEAFHLHPVNRKSQGSRTDPITLDHLLSRNCENPLSRRQRYLIALLVASSVAQLQSTPWLRTGLCKEDVIFFPSNDDDTDVLPYGEPFIRQGFSSNHAHVSNDSTEECNFYSLGIILLELCFGSRLEDYASYKKQPPAADRTTRNALNVMAALKWSRSVSGEGGEDYATAVKWCFTGVTDREKNWRSEIVKNVVRPLESCMEHLQAVAIV
ncbi:hypothetical protein yc1106_09076 [Curvularia clavata]|uniref:DUF7580 domain-containing protein n=1 Tax=Curvularia clavata TaxID=95742 RepID=A0A9Q9DWE6_CURCL|nr:hypothetical protein yc1106_09076 [Curvularia clavata]